MSEERRARLEAAVVWTAKDVDRKAVVDGIVATLEENEGKRRRAHGRGLRLPYLDDMHNPEARVTVKCVTCPGWYRVTKEKFRAEIFASHINSDRHRKSVERNGGA